jgi:hypothetical protein
MTSDQPPAGPPPEGPGRRRPPTIELTAEEAQTEKGSAAAASRPARILPGRASIPLLAAGAACAIGLLLAIAALFAFRGTGDRTLDARIARVERELGERASRPLPEPADSAKLDDLAARIGRLDAAMEARPLPAPEPALANRISTLEGELKALSETVAILSRRSDDIATSAREARQRAEAAAAALAAIERGELETLASRVAAVERAARSAEAELAKRSVAATRDQEVRLAVAAAALQTAVEGGEPFAAELAAAKALSAAPEPLAALDGLAPSGVPAAEALARELSSLIPALSAAAGGAPRNGGILDRLQANAEKLVRIRPLEEVPGSDPAAIVARIEVKAIRADLVGALAELSQLPASVRAPAEPWIKKAQARVAAIAASRRAAADALAGLGK